MSENKRREERKSYQLSAREKKNDVFSELIFGSGRAVDYYLPVKCDELKIVGSALSLGSLSLRDLHG